MFELKHFPTFIETKALKSLQFALRLPQVRSRLLGCRGADLPVVKLNGVQITARGVSNESGGGSGP